VDKGVDGRNNEVDGDELPKPLAALVGKSCSVPTPDIINRSDPKVVLLSGFVDEPPTGEEPATTTTPAALVQYDGPD